MGEVVELEAPPKAALVHGERPRSPLRSSRRRSKTALVLGGGGFTGGVYQIGALRALDLLTVNRTVNDFDIYIGTSAGAFVSSLIGERHHSGGDVASRQQPGPDAIP